MKSRRVWKSVSQWEDFEQLLGACEHKETWDQSCAAHFREGFLAQNHLTWQDSMSTGNGEGLASEKFYNVTLLWRPESQFCSHNKVTVAFSQAQEQECSGTGRQKWFRR